MLGADNFVSFTCRLSRNYGRLILLEPKGTLLACVGIGVGSIIDKRRVENVVKVGTVSNREHCGISCRSGDMVKRFDFLTTGAVTIMFTRDATLCAVTDRYQHFCRWLEGSMRILRATAVTTV